MDLEKFVLTKILKDYIKSNIIVDEQDHLCNRCKVQTPNFTIEDKKNLIDTVLAIFHDKGCLVYEASQIIKFLEENNE